MWQEARMFYHSHIEKWTSWYSRWVFLKAFRQRRLNRVLHYAGSKLPFYHEWAGGSFEQFPVVDKGLLQEYFAQLNVPQLSQKEVLGLSQDNQITVHQSLGTTGNRGIYVASKQESLNALRHMLYALLPKSKAPYKVAVFHLSSEPYFPYKFCSEKTEIVWSFFNLSEDFEKLILKLQHFQPNVLIAPVQTLFQLALLQKEKKISLSLKKVISTAEVLNPLEEKIISSYFEQPVHQLYQCAEGWLGMTCEYGTLHLNEDLFIIETEWIDAEKKRFIPVITSLERFIQPLIRYRMDDMMIIKSTPCACGSAAIAVEKIVGRCEDILYFSQKYNPSLLKAVYPDSIYLALKQVCNGALRYQILQHSPHHLEIKIPAENNGGSIQAIIQALDPLWELQEVRHPKVTFSVLENMPSNQMFRQTQRLSVTEVKNRPIHQHSNV